MEELDIEYIGALVKRAKKKDSDALAELYAATYPRCYRFGCRYLKDSALAREALQETYILAFKNINSLNEPKFFTSWLNRLMFRVCFRMRAQKQASGTEEDRAKLGDTSENISIPVDGRSYLTRQIMSLPASESQALLHYYHDGLKVAEIAHLMEIKPGEVKRYLAEGRKKLSGSAAH